jgi:hypothetical protein
MVLNLSCTSVQDFNVPLVVGGAAVLSLASPSHAALTFSGTIASSSNLDVPTGIAIDSRGNLMGIVQSVSSIPQGLS